MSKLILEDLSKRYLMSLAKGLEDVFQMMAEGLKKLHEKEVIV